MKRTWKILILCLALLTVLSLFAACGDAPDEPSTGDPNTPPTTTTPPDENKPDEPSLQVSVKDIDFLRGNGIEWSQSADGKVTLSVTYDGEPHMLTADNYEGDPNPERAVRTFEYYLNGTLIACYDEDGIQFYGDEKYENGLIEAGTYEVRLVCSYTDYQPSYKSATFVIAQSYEIEYVVGTPTGSGVPAMKNHTNNPTYFTTSESEIPLYAPTMDSEDLGYNFRGWYTAADCNEASRIELIDGPTIDPALLSSGKLTLFAKFEACVAYPPLFVDSTVNTPVTSIPETIPAIPGYADMDPNAFKLYDFSILKDSGSGLGYSYGTMKDRNEAGESVYVLNKEPAVQTEAGEYILRWQDPNDLWDGPVRGTSGDSQQMHVAGDGMFGAMMSLASPAKGFNYDNYDTLEFWIYNANYNTSVPVKQADGSYKDTPVDGNTFTMLAFVNGDDKTSMYIDIKLDFTGWKKFSIHHSDFHVSSGSFDFNITKINFYGYNAGSGLHAENATLALDNKANHVYFSDFFLTNTSSSYCASANNGFVPNAAEISAVLDKMVANTSVNTISDSDVATLLAQMNDNGSFKDITPSDSAEVKNIYERIYNLACAWNNPASTYYKSSDLLNKIATGLNFMSSGAAQLVNAHVVVDAYYEDAAYYLAKTATIISAYTNTKHAESWMAPVFYFVPTAMGSGARYVKTAYTYACASAVVGDSVGLKAGIRSIASALCNNRVTLALGAADMTDAFALVAAAYGTPFMNAKSGNTIDFVADLFDWFYYSVDSFLVNGTVPADISARTDYVTFETYLRAMLSVYSIATEEQQAKFAAAVKYYMAQDPTLEATIRANAKNASALAGLDAVKASTATAATPTADAKVIRIYEDIGQALYKTADKYVLIDRVGATIGASIDALDHDRLYMTIIGDVIAIAATNADDSVEPCAIFIADGEATQEYYPLENSFVSFNSGDTYVVVSSKRTANISVAAAGSISAVDGAPVIVGTTKDADGNLVLKMYNYTQATNNITVTINGSYSFTGSDNLYTVEAGTNKTTVIFNLLIEDTEFVRKSTVNEFELVLIPD